MLNIKVTKENTSAIESALKAANGRAKGHTYTVYSEVEGIANAYEKKVIALVGAKARAIGAKVSFQSGDELPNAYKYKRLVTVGAIERRASGWFLISLGCVEGYNEAGREKLVLTKSQDGVAIEQLRKQYSVKPE